MPKGKNVSEEDRRDWLAKYEEGNTLKTIAEAAKRPVRTVKENIERAKHNRDHALVRAGLLKDAMTHHYRDLFRVAEQVRDRSRSRAELELTSFTESAAVSDILTVDELQTSLLMDALREHVPRSPLWKACDEWDGYNRQALAAAREIRKDAKGVVTKLASRKQSLPINPEGFAASLWQAALAFLDGDDLSERKYVKDETSVGHVLVWGATSLGGPSPDDQRFDAIKRVHRKKVRRYTPDGHTMVNTLGQAIRGRMEARDSVEEEVEGLILRRILPGECRLCPGDFGSPTGKVRRKRRGKS